MNSAPGESQPLCHNEQNDQAAGYQDRRGSFECPSAAPIARRGRPIESKLPRKLTQPALKGSRLDPRGNNGGAGGKRVINKLVLAVFVEAENVIAPQQLDVIKGLDQATAECFFGDGHVLLTPGCGIEPIPNAAVTRGAGKFRRGHF